MKDRGSDIEKLFRDSFESYEADVDPSVWDAIADKIGAQPTVQDPSSSASSSAGAGGGAASSISVAKIAIIAAASGIISFGAYTLFSNDEEEQQAEQEVLDHVEEPKPLKEAFVVQDEVESEPRNQDRITAEEIDRIPASEVEKTEGPETGFIENSTQAENTQGQSTVISNKTKEENKTEPADRNVVAAADPITEDEQVESKPKQEQTPEERIEEMDNFEASIYSSVTSGKEPLEVRFENRGSMATSVRWIVDNGEEYYSQAIRHTFETSGDHWVYLEIENENGRKSRDSVVISVQGSAYINVNNVITPNGDGNNDAWMVETKNVGEIRCEIYDRAGNMVYFIDNINGHWNGRDQNNRQLQEGVYFYIIQAKDLKGNALEVKKGTVTLFR